jgi:hypothetical protein
MSYGKTIHNLRYSYGPHSLTGSKDNDKNSGGKGNDVPSNFFGGRYLVNWSGNTFSSSGPRFVARANLLFLPLTGELGDRPGPNYDVVKHVNAIAQLDWAAQEKGRSGVFIGTERWRGVVVLDLVYNPDVASAQAIRGAQLVRSDSMLKLNAMLKFKILILKLKISGWRRRNSKYVLQLAR